MARYVVLYKDKAFINKEFAKDVYGMGSRQLFYAGLAKGIECKPSTLLDSFCYEVPRERFESLKDVTIQDIDSVLVDVSTMLDIANVCAEELTQVSSFLTLDKWKLVPVREIKHAKKYTLLDRLPSVKVFGSIYIFAGAITVGIDNPLYVTVSA